MGLPGARALTAGFAVHPESRKWWDDILILEDVLGSRGAVQPAECRGPAAAELGGTPEYRAGQGLALSGLRGVKEVTPAFLIWLRGCGCAIFCGVENRRNRLGG